MSWPKHSAWYNLLFKTTIPNNIENVKSKMSFLDKINATIKVYRRFLLLLLNNQLSLELEYLPNNIKKVLWVNISSTSLGDSIMELSGRVLLRDKFIIDLVTNKRNYAIYKEDDIFNNIYLLEDSLPNDYDFILLDVNNTKSIKFKTHHFKNIPFISLMGYFYGADFNRMLFSFHRINAILNYPYAQNDLDNMSKNYLHLQNKAVIKNNNLVIVAVGGEDKVIRTYNDWGYALSALHAKLPLLNFLLIGSENGLIAANEIMALNLSRIESLVNQCSILEAANHIQRATYFLGADGGLMHIAEAFNLYGVTLFAKFNPEFRLSKTTKLKSLYDKTSVSNISPDIIINAFSTIVKNS